MRTLVFALALIVSSTALAQATKWERVEKTLEVLLNEGWQIESYNPRKERNESLTHTFVLTQASKYVLCDVFRDQSAPAPARFSRCYAIN
jgi:hypothetical protein